MSLSTPPPIKRGQLWTRRGQSRPHRTNVHAAVHAVTTPRCGQENWQISAASDPLSTLSTPYVVNNEVEWGMGVNAPVFSRDRFSPEGVDTLGVDRGAA